MLPTAEELHDRSAAAPQIAPAGAGMPTKKFDAHAGRSGSSSITLKRASRRPGADRKHHARRSSPADFRIVQSPEIQDQRRRNAEIDEVREAVEFGAEPRRALEHARDAAVDAVEQRREDDAGERPVEAAFGGEPDRRQAGAQAPAA